VGTTRTTDDRRGTDSTVSDQVYRRRPEGGTGGAVRPREKAHTHRRKAIQVRPRAWRKGALKDSKKGVLKKTNKVTGDGVLTACKECPAERAGVRFCEPRRGSISVAENRQMKRGKTGCARLRQSWAPAMIWLTQSRRVRVLHRCAAMLTAGRTAGGISRNRWLDVLESDKGRETSKTETAPGCNLPKSKRRTAGAEQEDKRTAV